jgi:hypothetical protein
LKPKCKSYKRNRKQKKEKEENRKKYRKGAERQWFSPE